MGDSPAELDRTLPDGRQRAPRPVELLRSAPGVLRRVPGIAVAVVRHLTRRGRVDHVLVDHDGPAVGAPDGDRPMPGDPALLLRRRSGRGPLYRRTYDIVVAGARTGPEELITRLLEDPDDASPTQVADFRAAGPGRGPGAEFAVTMPGPWDAPVRVVSRTPTSFRFATLRGNLEAGEIEFRAARGDGDRLHFTIESWARSGDRLYDRLYDRVPLTREVQLHMWVHVCRRVAAMTGGRQEGDVRVVTDRWRAGG